MEIDELQQKLVGLEDDKLMAEMKIQEQEIHIQEQFEIIQDYSNEIEDHNIREQLQNQRIHELEEELQQVLDTKCKDSLAFIEKARNQDTNDVELEDISYNLALNSEFTANSGAATDRGNANRLREDMDQINEQFQALGLMDDFDVNQNNAKNVHEITSKGSGGSHQSYLSNRNKYCFNNVTHGL